MSDENALNKENTIRPLAALPPVEYLLTCSKLSLQDLELAALARVANHLKAAKLEWELAATQKELAGVARWLIECRDQLLEQSARTLEVHTTPQFPDVLQMQTPKKRQPKPRTARRKRKRLISSSSRGAASSSGFGGIGLRDNPLF